MKRILRTLFGTEKVQNVIPGTILALTVMTLAMLLASYLGDFFKAHFDLKKSPVSTFLLAIILGMFVRNITRLPAYFESGIKFCVAKLLRLGIIFLGIRLSILAVAKIGIVAVFVVLICIFTGIIVSNLFARVFGVSNKLGTLIAAGTGICGVSAIVATSPVINAKEEETAYAISTITIFGLLATILYPYLVELIFRLNLGQSGIFLGTAIHDTAQVTGAAYIYDQLWLKEVSKIAITTKLIRNTFLMAVIPVCAIMYAKRQNEEGAGVTQKVRILKLFPVFVLGFLGFVIFRSIGDIFISGNSGSFLIWSSSESWTQFYTTIKLMAKYILAVAIAGAGLSTQFNKLKKLSFKPFLIGLMAAVSVGMVSFILVKIFSSPISSLISVE